MQDMLCLSVKRHAIEDTRLNSPMVLQMSDDSPNLTADRFLAALADYGRVGGSESADLEYDVFLDMDRPTEISYSIPRRDYKENADPVAGKFTLRAQARLKLPTDLEDVPCSIHFAAEDPANLDHGSARSSPTAPRTIGIASFVSGEGLGIILYASLVQVRDILLGLSSSSLSPNVEVQIGICCLNRWTNQAGEEMADFDVIDLCISIRK